MNSLEELKLDLKPKLCLNAKSIDKDSIDKLLANELFNDLIQFVLLKIEEDDAGANVVKILDYCFEQKPLLNDLYASLTSNKVKYILIDYLTEKFKDKKLGICEADLNFLIELFAKCLNKPFDNASEIDKVELVKLSDLMCLLSTAKCKFNSTLINKELINLLIDNLLHLHTLGKQQNSTDDKNEFKIISKLSQINDPDALSKETFFGFKSNLIGLLGNFAYSNKEIQNWIRELDGISLILDCTNIDARNPFIMQWSIFALRNILHKNEANQEFVKRVTKKGNEPLKIDLSKIM